MEKQKGVIPMGHSLAGVVLPRFALRVPSERGITSVYYYSVENGKLNVVLDKEQLKRTPDYNLRFTASEKVYMEEGTLMSAMFIEPDGLKQSFIDWLNAPISDEDPDKREEEPSISRFEKLMQAFFLVNDFLRMPRSELECNIEERECMSPSGRKSGSNPWKKGRSVVRTVRTYTLKKSFLTAIHRKPVVYTCASWGVKGHTRRLRDGRIIFVKPYVKGRERDKYVGKEYVLRSPL